MRAPRVFCSYGGPDRETVEAFATWLRDNGVDVWLDRWKIEPGQSFVERIEQGLRDADRVLVFLSRQSVDRVWRRAEAEAAIVRMVEDGIRVIPVRLDADAPLPILLGPRSAWRLEQRDEILASIRGRSPKPVLGPPPELWHERARRLIEQRFAAARHSGTLDRDGMATIEGALRRLLEERLRWIQSPGAQLAHVAIDEDEEDAEDLRLPLELLRPPASASPMVVRCELAGTKTTPEAPCPRPEGGRIVLATAEGPDRAVLEAVQQACRAGLHHAADPGSEPRRAERNRRRGAFDPGHDHLHPTSRAELFEGLKPRDGRPGAAMLLLVCRVSEDGLCLGTSTEPSTPISTEDLAATLEPSGPYLRLVVLIPVADESTEGDAGLTIVDAALALHRRGIAAVAAPRVPLPTAAVPGLARDLLDALLGNPSTVPCPLEAALGQVNRRLRAHEGLACLGLRLYARAADGDDTRPLVILPYRGLLSFEPEHARFYLGREREIDTIVERLARFEQRGQPRMLLLLGASGVGKSSLAKAGVVPKLCGDGRRWSPLLTRPDDDGPRPIEARVEPIEDSRPLVVVDQLEEALDAGITAATAYLRRLWALAQDPRGTTVVATLGVDALGELGDVQIDETGGSTLEQIVIGPHGLYVCHLDADALRRTIVEPARHVGLTLDDGLVERLSQEALAEPGALPMLEVALQHLWSARQGHRLPARAFRDGLAGTLARQADACIDRLPEAQRAHARRILVRIATGPEMGIATWRRRTTVQALRPEFAPRRAAFDEALEHLVSGRLVVTGEARGGHKVSSDGAGGDVPIELAHELLLRRWDALQRWIEEDRPTLQAIWQLERWVQEWTQRKTTLLTTDQLGYLARAELTENGDDLNAPMRQLLHDSHRAVRRSRRVRRALWVGTGVISLMLAGLTYVAMNERNEANKQAEIAKREQDNAEEQTEIARQQTSLAKHRLDQAVKLTDVLIYDVLPELDRYPRVGATKKRILGLLQKMQQQLGTTEEDFDARWNDGAAHLVRGDEALVSDDVPTARREYEAALEIAKELTDAYPRAAEAQQYLFISMNTLADLEVQAGNLTTARDLFEHSLQIADALADTDPHSAWAQRNLSVSLEKLASLEAQAGDLATARDLFARSLQIADALANTYPHSALTQRNLSVALDNLGNLEIQAGDLAAARDLFARSLQIADALAGARPHSKLAQRDLSISLSQLGNLEVQAGDLTVARDLLTRSLAMREALADATPNTPLAQRDLSVSLNNLGNLEVQAGNLDVARDLFTRSLAMREALADADPHSALAQRDLSVSLNNLGNLEVQASNLTVARNFFTRDLAIAETLANADPHNAEASFDVVLSHMHLMALAAREEDINAFRMYVTAAKAGLEAMDAKGHITGYQQRESVRAQVEQAVELLATLP